MEIIVRIMTDDGEAGYYKLIDVSQKPPCKYKWVYLYSDTSERNLYLTLFKSAQEYYSSVGYHFDFEEGDLERLR